MFQPHIVYYEPSIPSFGTIITTKLIMILRYLLRTMNIQILPEDLDYNIGIHFDYYEVIIFGQVNERYSRLLKSPLFWERKALHDFGCGKNKLDKIYPTLTKEKYIKEREAYLKLAADREIPLPYTEKYGDIDKLIYSAARRVMKEKSPDLDTLIRLLRIEFNSDIFRSFNHSDQLDIIDKLGEIFPLHKLDMLNSAILGAACTGKIELVKAILARGATNTGGACNFALHSKNWELIEFLANFPDVEIDNVLLNASRSGDIQLVKFCISKGATDFNLALSGAAEAGSWEIINLLLSQGADDYEGALIGAAQTGQFLIMKYMVEKGARDYNEALTFVIMIGHIPAVQFLLERGGSLNQTFKYVGDCNSIPMVEFLIKKGGNDFYGALKIAAQDDNLLIFRYLFKYALAHQILPLLYKAIKYKRYPIIKFIIDQCPEIIGPQDIDYIKNQAGNYPNIVQLVKNLHIYSGSDIV